MENSSTDPFRSGNTAGMNTLSECYESAVKHGYTEQFSVTPEGLYTPTTRMHYQPDQVHVVNFYRFEGSSNPDDMSILYIIETTDGPKGTLIDAYGTYADSDVNEFITAVHDFHKQVDKK